MDMKLVKGLFGKRRAADETGARDIDELPSCEEPLAQTGDGLLRAETPRGTGMNRSMVMLVGGAFLAVAAVSGYYAFQTDDAKDPKAAKAKERGVAHASALPERLNNLPDRAQPLPQNPNGDPNAAALQQMNGMSASPYAGTGGGQSYYYGGSGGPAPYDLPRPSIPRQQGGDGGQNLMGVYYDAQRSPIRFGGMNDNGAQTVAAGGNASQPYAANSATLPNQQPQNGGWQQRDPQEDKENFLNKNRNSPFYANSQLVDPMSRYELQAGAIIPATLISGINSDLPGRIVAQVRENVYDSVTGQYLLVPQGTRLIGTYDSKVTYAQDRVLLVWNRMILPNGVSIDLENMRGVDMGGYAGLKERVNNHSGRLFTGAILGSIFSALPVLAVGGNYNTDNLTPQQMAAMNAAQRFGDAANRLNEKNLSVQPTLEISPGYRFNVFVDRDFVLRPYNWGE